MSFIVVYCHDRNFRLLVETAKKEKKDWQVGERKILSSWKEIANYLKIRVRTAQRWEEKLGLPFHRM